MVLPMWRDVARREMTEAGGLGFDAAAHRCNAEGTPVGAEDAIEAARELPIVIITSVSLIPSYSSCQLRLRACCVTQAGLAQTYRRPTGHAGKPRWTNVSTHSLKGGQ